jgi:catecholate siderophore receptor
MSHITSRKHAASRPFPPATALMAALALPMAAAAQQAASAPAAPASAATLPAVKVQAAAESDYKADASASPKFTQPLLDTPQTVTVLKKELLQQQAATTLTEALRNTPGVVLQLGENGSTQTGDAIYLRGFDTSTNIFLDGVRDLGTVSRDLFNVEQVEVVKGPAGSDIGRGASSAYINLISKAPQKDRFEQFTATVGNASRKRATADLNQPLDIGVPGAALRLNLMWQDNGAPGRDAVRAKRWGVAPTLAFGLGTGTRATFAYQHLQQDNTPDGGVPTFGLPGYLYGTGTGTAFLKPGPAVDRHGFYGMADDHDDAKLDMFTARFEHDLAPGTTLRNTTRLGRTVEDVLVTGVNAVTNPSASTTAAPSTYLVTRSHQGRHQDNEILTNQTNLSTRLKAWGVEQDLSAGVELIYESQRTATPVAASGSTLATGAAHLYAPSQGDPLADPKYVGNYAKGSTLTAAAYVFDTLKFNDRWALNGGVRWDKYHTETNQATGGTATVATVQQPLLSLTDSVTSWKLGLVFKPVDSGSIYVETSDSRQPPGGTNFALSSASSSQASTSTAPQEGRNVELGTKWEFLDGRLAATGALYRSTNSNELVSDGQTPATYSQIGKRRVQGLELGLVGAVTDKLDLSAGLATAHSEIVRGTPANQGGVIVFTPKLSFTSWATYKLPAGFTVGGGARYVDNVARNSNTAPQTANLLNTPSYWVADAMVGWQATKAVQLQLNVYNLFDKKYLTTLNNGGSRYTPGAPRNALLTAAVKF